MLVIGGGPAGITAAIYTSRADLKTLVIDKGLTSGALGITSKIANYPGVTDEVSGAELLERMRSQARSFGTEFATDRVIGVDINADDKNRFWQYRHIFRKIRDHRHRLHGAGHTG